MIANADRPYNCAKCDQKIKKNEHYMYLVKAKGHEYVHIDCEY